MSNTCLCRGDEVHKKKKKKKKKMDEAETMHSRAMYLRKEKP
jgi:hypothetical protein